MAWFSSAKKKVKRYSRGASKAGRFYGKVKINSYRQGYRRARSYNRRHNIIGWSPDNFISPIDAIPPAALVRKGQRAHKLAKRGVNTAKASYRGYKRSKSRRGSSKSSLKSKARRGIYYYYKGKRYYTKADRSVRNYTKRHGEEVGLKQVAGAGAFFYYARKRRK